MSGVLIIFILNVTSSYKDNTEYHAEKYFDVLEWWITEENTYRVKTFSIDSDIQIAQMKSKTISEMVALAEENTRKHYGDVLVKEIKIKINNMKDEVELLKVIKEYNLAGKFENKSILFWNPDGRKYESKTKQ